MAHTHKELLSQQHHLHQGALTCINHRCMRLSCSMLARVRLSEIRISQDPVAQEIRRSSDSGDPEGRCAHLYNRFNMGTSEEMNTGGVSNRTLSCAAAASPRSTPLYLAHPSPGLPSILPRGWKAGRQGSVLPCRLPPSPLPSTHPH